MVESEIDELHQLLGALAAARCTRHTAALDNERGHILEVLRLFPRNGREAEAIEDGAKAPHVGGKRPLGRHELALHAVAPVAYCPIRVGFLEHLRRCEAHGSGASCPPRGRRGGKALALAEVGNDELV